MADVFEVLGSDHADVKRMLAELERSPDNSTGATGAVLRARKQVAERLIIDTSAHEAAEERYLWPVVRARVAGGAALAAQAMSQESRAKEILARIGRLSAADPEFDQLIETIIPDYWQHIQFEETQVWPGLREALSPAEAEDLGRKILAAKEHGPAMPHPAAPASPALLKTVGPAVAVTDKLRDAVSALGRPS
jgi:hypothetical protein